MIGGSMNIGSSLVNKDYKGAAINLGSMLDLATLGCQICPEGMIMRNQLADRTASYVQSIPDMSGL